nr:phosphoglycolate phosphatase [uncultured Cohaesibacter sp.]
MTSRRFSCVLFDLDGTLVDTAPDLTGALNHVLAQYQLAPFSVEKVRNTVGFGARITIERSMSHYNKTLSEEALDIAHAQFLAHYSENICKNSQLFPGVKDVLEMFKANDIRMSVCTNKTEHLSIDLLDQIGIADYFASICGSDTVPNKKPHPDHVFSAINRAGGKCEEAILIGDSQADVQSARAAGIPVIVMSYGYTAVPSAELGADLVLDSFLDIPKTLETWPKALEN